MRVTIDDPLKQKCPRVALGVLTAGVMSTETPAGLAEELKKREAEILALPDPRSVLESSRVLATRAGYKALGKDPARYRGSADALLRRIVSGKGLPQINAVVDVINLSSIESRLPIGLYDLDNVKGDIVFRTGRPGETYKGIGKYDLNLEDLAVFADDLGPHGSATSDSERTMVTLATKQIAALLVSFAGADVLPESLQRLSALLQQYASARDIVTEIVT